MSTNQYKNEGPKWLVKFYLGLWVVLKVLMIIGFIAVIIYLRIGFDKWYINWLTK